MKDIDIFRQGKVYARAIRDKRTEIMTTSETCKTHSDMANKIESQLLREINSDLDENNKKVYSNEGSRQAELRKRLDIHDEYSNLQVAIANNHGKIDELHIGVQFSQDMLNLLIAFLR